MQRIQILLKPETHRKAKIIAKGEKISVSQLIREVLEKEIHGRSPNSKDTTLVLRDAARKAVSGAPKDLGSNDSYLYESK